MNTRGWLKRLEKEAQGDMVAIPQADGSVKRFPTSALAGALLNSTATLRAMMLGEQPPPEHPLVSAARNSTERKWSESLYSGVEAREYAGDYAGDLSE